MGWSFSAKAGDTLEAIETEMRSKGFMGRSANVYKGKNGKIYMFAVSCRDQKDNSIVGSIHEFTNCSSLAETENSQSLMAVKKGSFKIDSNGKIVRFPFLPIKL
jgi:hypothetical protein